jgi:ubiquitin-activating enzyme E1
MEEATTIDEGLYSRQIYVLGADTLQALSKLNYLVVGLSGLGVEVAKNLSLAGPRSVTLYDNQPCSWMDMSAQFYVTEADVRAKMGRARASFAGLSQLNPYVKVVLYEGAELDAAFLAQFQVIIACDTGGQLAEKLDEFCRQHGKGFILGEARGPFSRLFVDFGPNFTIRDTDGQVS